jgi:lysyl-tRNA synthetase class 2
MTEQERIRRDKLTQMREMGIDPYPAGMFEVSHLSAEIVGQYEEEVSDDGSKTPLNFQEVRLAGRIMAIREAGKALFMHLQDSAGRIQLYVRREEIAPGEDTAFFDIGIKKLLDIGDYVGISGFAFRTRTGEVTVHVRDFQFLSKSLRPLPIVKRDAAGNVYDAFTDPEQRYRMRYVDLTVNPEYKQIFILRSRMISAMRRYFDTQGWLEVETPVLQPIHGGAAARPFATHHNTLDMPLYLRIANELYLKRLIGAGFDGVYEIGKMFRNEGMDRTHNPEFTSMEIYVAYKDYHWMMQMVEECLEFVVASVHGKTAIQVGEHTIEFKGPYKRLPIYEGIQAYTGEDIRGMDEAGIRGVCYRFHVPTEPSMGRGKLIDELFSTLVEPHLIQPTFVMDHPLEMTPLAKQHRDEPGLVERFELFVNRKEVANAYTELNDPLDQRARFEEQLALAARGDEEAMRMDEDFLRAMEYGMPPMSGLGIGIDRLAMLISGQTSIQEVLFFPQMRMEQQEDLGEQA